MSVSEQQPTVAHTYELSLPIKPLPGEDDVKLREGKLILIIIIIYLKKSNFRYYLLYT